MNGRVILSASAALLASAWFTACGGLNGNKVSIDGVGGTGGMPSDLGGSTSAAGTTTASAGTSSSGGTQSLGGSTGGAGKGGTGAQGGGGATSSGGGSAGSTAGGASAGTGGATTGGGGAGGGTCNTITQRGSTPTAQAFSTPLPAQTRGTPVPGTYVLVREDDYDTTSPTTPLLSTIEVTVNGNNVTVNFLNVHIAEGLFTFSVTLPAVTAPPTAITTTVSCSTSVLLPMNSSLRLDYSVLPGGVLTLAYIDFNTLATYMKL